MKKILIFFALICAISTQAQTYFTAAIPHDIGNPSGAPSQSGSRIRIDQPTLRLWVWDRINLTWVKLAQGIDISTGCVAPLYTPGLGQSTFALNTCTPPTKPTLYHWTGTVWQEVAGSGGGGGTWGTITGTLSDQTDLQAALDAKLSAEVDGSTTNELNTAFTVTGGNLRITDAGGNLDVPVTNIAPVQAVASGTGISIAGTTTRTITNTLPDQTVTITNGGGVVPTGTYPNFTLTATDQSATNEIQNLSLSGQSLGISSGTGVTLPVVGITAGSGITATPVAGVYTVTNTGDLSNTNEIQQIDTFAIVSNVLRASLSSDNVPFKSVSLLPYLDNTDNQNLSWNAGTGALSISGGTGANLDGRYITTEVDGSVWNEGALSVTAGTGTTSVIHSNTSGSTDVTINAGSGLSISETGSSITLANTSPNVVQSISLSGSGPTSYDADLSGGGGSVTFAEGANIDLTRTGNVLTIASTGGGGGGGGTWGTITGTLSSQTDLQAALNAKLSAEVDGSTTNELQNLSLAGQALGISSGTGVNLPIIDVVAGYGASVVKASGAATVSIDTSIVATTYDAYSLLRQWPLNTVSLYQPSLTKRDWIIYNNSIQAASSRNAYMRWDSIKDALGSTTNANGNGIWMAVSGTPGDLLSGFGNHLQAGLGFKYMSSGSINLSDWRFAGTRGAVLNAMNWGDGGSGDMSVTFYKNAASVTNGSIKTAAGEEIGVIRFVSADSTRTYASTPSSKTFTMNSPCAAIVGYNFKVPFTTAYYGGVGIWTTNGSTTQIRSFAVDSTVSTTVRFGVNTPPARINAAQVNGGGAAAGSNSLAVHNSTGTSNSLIVTNDAKVGIGVAAPAEKLEVAGNVKLTTAGNKVFVATGANASAGSNTLVAGVVTVSTTAVTAASIIIVNHANKAGNIGPLYITNIVAGTSFKINSDNVTDISNVNWWIIN